MCRNGSSSPGARKPAQGPEQQERVKLMWELSLDMLQVVVVRPQQPRRGSGAGRRRSMAEARDLQLLGGAPGPASEAPAPTTTCRLGD